MANDLSIAARLDFKPLDNQLGDAIRNGVAPGVVAIAAMPDGIIYEGAFGNAGLDDDAPISPDTVFWILSMTKAVTAAACMQMIEQGRLHVDQPAAEILPALASPQVLEGFAPDNTPLLRPAKRPITVRHLLTHTSGHTYSLWSEALARYEEVTGTPVIFSGKNAAFDVPLEFDPGERWHYGISLDWVGKLVEAVSGQSLDVYFRENIFSPLGMKDTGFVIGSEQRRRLATAAQRQPDGSLMSEPYEPPQRPEFFMGGTGLFSTPRDYLTFLRMLLQGGSLDGVRILKPQTVAAMMSNQIGDLNVEKMVSPRPARSNDFDLFPGMKHKWGFSFDINAQPGPFGRSVGSAAWAGALNTHYWIDPVKRVTGALFTQVWPFYDDQVVGLFNRFEQSLYRAIEKG
ncbi:MULTISPECIES: serine hydrolase domain-containing protein [unclassified Caballeronia]|uniref:serine hydrolase domain-containing protein n=1 Tax=unclassified Caballeronia TaxID=2646786 RepID=UPI0028621038|nr:MULTISPECIES: serine hydrolase domain-containing protein [unclassified Caballeronia]MDR5741152.1 serine hydrolase [Caballeronia sp. LZ016]MDR5807052.1 serine hydrolase [Caballeronia sp. LZ019]